MWRVFFKLFFCSLNNELLYLQIIAFYSVQIHSVAQKHVIDNSPDLIYDIIYTDKVECQKLDPNTIVLNDGSENLIRVQIGDTAETDSTSKYSRPISNNHESVDTDEINDANTDDDMVKEVIKENNRLLNEDSSNESDN